MWKFNNDFEKWEPTGDELTKNTFDIYKQEFFSYRFYSKCLSGATYIPVNNIDNIYDIISIYTPRNWYISTQGSIYVNTNIPIDSPVAIDKETSYEYYTKYLSEYGLTLKNKFTPERLIKDSINNFLTIDVATVEQIDVNNVPDRIDGVRLINGHLVLVKNQISSLVLPNSTDPNTVFEGNFTIVQDFGASTEYQFFNEENGIYLFNNGELIKQDDLDKYENAIRYSVSVKLGDINKDRQFHLSRLKSGYYPEPGQPIEFKERKNWLLRNQVDYSNLFEINFNDTLKHDEQVYNFEGFTYSIPERTITVGDFGVIVNNQNDISNIINNKYKSNLNSISETTSYYWIAGSRGMLLRVRKHDFNITRIEVDCQCPSDKVITNLNSIDFFNDLNGVAVGELNTILITNDGGLNWERIRINAFDSHNYNKVIYSKSNSFFIGGDNGIFIEFRRDLSGWTAYRRRISRFEDAEDDYLLVDNINDLAFIRTNNWNLDFNTNINYTNTPVTPLTEKHLVLIVTDDSKIIVHDTNSSIDFETQFFYLKIDENYGDITNISHKFGTNQIFFTATGNSTVDGGIFNLDLDLFDTIGLDEPTSNVIISSTQSISAQNLSNLFTTGLFDYKGQELIICGNNSISKKSEYITPLDFSDLDPDFDSRLKSKMLFLDYDIASKLNFFDNNGDYRLPDKTTFTFSNVDISFEPLDHGAQSEINWFNYWQDRKMTFEYLGSTSSIDNSNKVLISPTFSYSSIVTTDIIQPSGITSSLSGIQNLAPNIDDKESSRFYGTYTITAPIDDSYDIYLYDYLLIYKVDLSYPVKAGDVFKINADIISSEFIVNKIEEISGYKYIYMFTEFNQNIIKSLLNIDIEITNLNIFNGIDDFVQKVNSHPISIGYTLDKIDTDIIEVSANFNNLTAYYNMATKIIVDSDEHEMIYTDGFLKFGYTATYNILDFLSSIDSDVFTENKQYLAMPDYRGMPMSGSSNFTNNNIYIDYNHLASEAPNNKIIFGEDLKFEWQSIFLNTFVDIIIGDDNSDEYVNKKLLVTNKYKVENYENSGLDAYFIEFNKIIEVGNSPLISIDIISRRSLKQISNDLQELNNIQRSLIVKSYKNYDDELNSFEQYEKELNFRLNTDSYAKILLSDLETNEALTALIFIDNKNELSMNITRVDSERVVNILNTGNQSGKLLIICDGPHELNDGDGVILEFVGGQGSSEELNPQYAGFRTVTVINQNNFSVDVDFGVPAIVGNDIGFVKFIKKDPFLNYQPVDITDIGIDKRGTRAIEISADNTQLSENIISLSNVDFDKFRFRLVDGLDIEILSTEYSWIYEAEISDAVIGLTEGQLTWYKGTWECGRWFGGRWISGTWLSGDWYDGIWESKLIKDNWINVEVDDKSSNLESSVWFNGRWFDGTWNNGTWVNGRWYSGQWNNGRWFNGIWNDGTWNNGRFTGGIWILGDWNGGFFNTDNGPSYWLDGVWNAGDFENGMWYDGIFGEKKGESRFGIKSYNSRTSTWHSGDWISGSFHSRLNLDNEDNYIISNTHKYSIWRTGNWFSGNWFGGIAYNINFKSGIWHGGILEDIQIIGFNQTSGANNEVVLNGIFKFNIGDSISIIDNGTGLYPDIGSNQNPGKYTILNTVEDGNKTKIYIDKDISLITPTVSDTDTGLKIVSDFVNCEWKSGIWKNGIYQNGKWKGGIWYDGIFNANWM